MKREIIVISIITLLITQFIGCISINSEEDSSNYSSVKIEPLNTEEIEADMYTQMQEYENGKSAESLYKIMYHLAYHNRNGMYDEYAYKYYCEFFDRIFVDEELQSFYASDDEWDYYSVLNEYLFGVYEDVTRNWKEEINRIESQGKNKDYLLRGIGYFILDASGYKRETTNCVVYFNDSDMEYCLNLMLEYEEKYEYLESEGCYIIILNSISYLYKELGNEEQANIYEQKVDEWKETTR